jgi:hypothetical protein
MLPGKGKEKERQKRKVKKIVFGENLHSQFSVKEWSRRKKK